MSSVEVKEAAAVSEDIYIQQYIKISTIGLDGKDLNLLRNILKVAPKLQGKFVIAENAPFSTANVLFVNADNDESIKTWQNSVNNRSNISSVLVTTKQSLPHDETVVRRPLNIKQMVGVLEEIVKKQTFIKNMSRKILIVDDSLSVRKYMEHKLPGLASDLMSLEFAETGKGAMEKIKNSSYDVVFLDVVMPEVDGYKVCKWIKSVRPDTRVIMLTSKKSPFDKIRGSMSGCDTYLTKPPTDEKLRRVLLS